MLKYKIKLQNNVDNLEEFIPLSLYASKDLSYVSGITTYNKSLENNDIIYIMTNQSNDYKEYNIKTYNKICRGFVIYKQKYKIKKFKYYNTDLYGIIFGDGNKYISDFDGNLTIESLFVPNSKKYNPNGDYDTEKFDKGQYVISNINDNTTEIELLTKYYVYDNYVTIGNIDYLVDYDTMSSINYETDKNFLTVSDSKQLDYEKTITLNTDDNQYKNYETIETIGNISSAYNYSISKPQIILKNNEILDIYDYNHIFKVCHFIIYKKQDYQVTVEHISFTKPYYYIESGVTTPYNEYITPNKLYIKYSLKNYDHLYYLNDINNINQKFDYFLVNDSQKIVYNLLNDNFNIKESINEININNVVYEIKVEWKNTSSGNNIHLYLSDDYYFETGQKINIFNNNSISSKINVLTDGNNEYVIIQGKRYDAEKKPIFLMVYYNNEYEIFSQSYSYFNDSMDEINTLQYYIIYNKNPLLINVEKDENGDIIKAKRKIMDENDEKEYTYEVNKYNYIMIDSKKYCIYDHEIISYIDNDNTAVRNNKVINYLLNKPLQLSVNQITSSNQLRCTVIGNVSDTTEELYNIVNYHSNYSFFLANSLLDDSFIENTPEDLKDYINNSYRFFFSINNITLPLLLNNNNGTNLFQEYVCETQFFGIEKEKAINSIVDMEKEIYYPGYYDNDTNAFIDVDEIVFDLHFRTRDLSTWKINNDIYDNNNFKGEDEVNDKISSMIGFNWNIFDFYNTDEKDMLNKFKPYFDITKYPYYQPSDLLYFLNFTDDDIFYQKSKVGKSFLRLSFFDSTDPRNQNLLATSTVFMNEGNLYKNFINNRVNNGLYLSVNKIQNKNNRQLSKNIGVNFEQVEMDNRATLNYTDETLIFPINDEVYYYPISFDENKRMASSFKIKNMFESSESSEGFYLYLFREYNSGLHEKTIYLKVEFNHAGIGRTINFMQPYKINSDQKQMLDLSNKEDLKLLKKGCQLQNLYDYLYIPIKIKYDFSKKKYYYYLPKWLTEHNIDNNGKIKKSEIRFNLFELKIANES